MVLMVFIPQKCADGGNLKSQFPPNNRFIEWKVEDYYSAGAEKGDTRKFLY
jgi:hypothetical protein